MPHSPPPDPDGMPVMTLVKSSTIYSIGYDDDALMLFVKFRASGRKPMPGSLYRYVKVSRTIWNRFQVASSFGKYLESKVKGRYGYSKWTGRTWRPEAVLRVVAAKDRRERALKKLREKIRRG